MITPGNWNMNLPISYLFYLLSKFKELGIDVSKSTYLEIGCYIGNTFGFMSHFFKRTIALEYNEMNCQIARANLTNMCIDPTKFEILQLDCREYRHY